MQFLILFSLNALVSFFQSVYLLPDKHQIRTYQGQYVTQENVVTSKIMTKVNTLGYSGNGTNDDRYPILNRVVITNVLNTLNGYKYSF